MIRSLYLGRLSYEEGLHLQAEIADLVAEGRLDNVLLLLEHPAVLTLGRNANRANVLASDEELKARAIALHETRRGGDVTYHGPGQLVGYPIINLRSLRNKSGSRMGPVDFVRAMEEALIRVCDSFNVNAGRVPGLTGVWCGLDQAGPKRKIAAIGIHVARGITSHGFAFNVTTDLRDFDLIIPCGISEHEVTSLDRELAVAAVVAPSLETVAHRVAKEFGMTLEQQIENAESLAALRANASVPSREFPAEDTPLRIPKELQRLKGIADAPARG